MLTPLRFARGLCILSLVVGTVSLILSYPVLAKGKGGFGGGGGGQWDDPAAFFFPGYDANGDGRLDRSEWKRRGNFERLDTNKNGTIEIEELRVLYGAWGKKGTMTNPILPGDSPVMDGGLEKDKISHEAVGRAAICGLAQRGIIGVLKCAKAAEMSEKLGLIETGLGPVFPKTAFCHGIDEIFALDYSEKTGSGKHGGIDLPTDFGTPILAAAAGTVVAKFDPDINARGKTVVLRHSPEDTGLPFWTYTEYAHMDVLPRQAIGQRVRMGEVLGPTGNSGISKKNKSGISNRRPGIHFAVYYSDSRRFAEIPNYIISENGRWMDSNALYRRTPPYDSPSLRATPDAEKGIPIPVMYLDGSVEPAGTKLIWPYACKRG